MRQSCLFLFNHFYRPQHSCGKVMFSQTCVKNSVHRGWVCIPACTRADNPHPVHALGRHLPGQTSPPPGGHCNGRCVSYWNAFLSLFVVGCFHKFSWFRILGDFICLWVSSRNNQCPPEMHCEFLNSKE